MLQIILKMIGFLIILCGVIMIYDARILTDTYFSFGDRNEATLGFKILGFIVCIVGMVLVYFNM